ncbi:Cof-type HAD-IIB family hydrolase [Deinococcus maricopensis]|uniref:Cof-like hydrolase n=1 Tax=Deinococcus maricopensis (strain DSM 21211 / LMG 22137 / NRRL B-23946 / LB-34) TaxID=709986 RepID=E8U8T3_DEIML|nr:Cof-type HAD-IIB family hydrolase [Deinococcus maricopensis]ADV67472.1 Cof-like hydrolase [Deinococcus maricopensis DSM 21211]
MLGLICIDVDGTLVGSGGVIPEVVWRAAEDARERGVHLALCSGRPALAKARAYAQRLDPHGWHVFQNGASIVHVGTGESLSAAFPEDALHRQIQQARATGRLLEVYSDTDMAVEQDVPRARAHADLLGLPFQLRPLDSLPGTVVRTQWVIPIEETDALLAEPHEGLTLHPAGSPVMPDTMFVSVTRAGVDKGSAVRRVAEKLGVAMERVMMVGDGHNDVLAMQVVGHPVAMGNADAEARAAARYTVGHVDDGGLAEAIELAFTL